MQPPAGPQPIGMPPPGRPGEPLVLYNQAAIKNNMTILGYNRIFAALVAGCVAGILGITGYRGAGVFVASQLVIALALVLKAGFNTKKYFVGGPELYLSGIISQTEVLTFILFWTLSNNLVYLF